MKKIIAHSFLVIVSLSIFSFTLKNDPKKDIIGIWKIDESFVPKMLDKMLQRVAITNPEQLQILESQKENIIEGLKSTTIEYKANKEYVLIIGLDKIPRKGSWNILEGDSILKKIDSEKEITEDKILELNQSRLVILKTSTKDTVIYKKYK